MSIKKIIWQKAKEDAKRVAELSGNNNRKWIEEKAIFNYNVDMQNYENMAKEASEGNEQLL